MIKIKNVLISVYDKKNLLPLLKCLKENNATVYSTGGTYSFIKKNGFNVKKIETLTAYPEILSGRVKTLHPNVFGGVLADLNNAVHKKEINAHKIVKFDAVVVNLYPFQRVKKTTPEKEAVELIDIGGMALLRAAAKNFSNVCAVSSEKDYLSFIKELNQNKGSVSFEFSRQQARKTFEKAFNYDFKVYNYFSGSGALNITLENKSELRYGENPHQKAVAYYKEKIKQHQGKEISYNNILDADAALQTACEFKERVCVIIKHNNPCGCAFGKTAEESFKKAWAGDPLSAFGSVIAFNKTVDEALARAAIENFIEAVIAPSYNKGALEIFKAKPSLRVIETNFNKKINLNLKSTVFGVLNQTADNKLIAKLKKVSGSAVSLKTKEDMIFAYKIVKNLKSNAVCFVKNKQLLAMGCGGVSRVDAVKNAVRKAAENNFSLKGAALASDAFFPFADNIDILKDLKLGAIIQPGGSVRDNEVIAACVKHKIPMFFCGIRHFKH